MPKLKKPKLDINKKEKAFIYEIIGIVAILLAIIALAKFGLIGKYLVLAFCLLFGDWYFIFIILVGIFGLYCLIFHKKFELKSIRYYGIILILLSMLILTHFSMHEYISNYEGNSLILTFNLYLNYFRTGNTQMIEGGGIIGCIFFYIFYYLLGSVGTIIVSIILFFVGIVFLTKKTIKEFLEVFIQVFKKISLFVNKKYKGLVNSVKEISKDYGKDNKFLKIFKLKDKFKIIKKEKEVVDKVQIDRSEEITNILYDVFNHLNIRIETISYLICEHIVVFFVKTKEEVNYKVLQIQLNDRINEDFLIKYDNYNEQILIEINRINPQKLSLYKASQIISKNEFSLVFGIDDRNLLIELDDNTLIVGADYKKIEVYLLSIISFSLSQRKYVDNTIILLDINKRFNCYKLDKIIIKNDLEYLDKIIEEIDKNLELLNIHHKKDVDEYNMFFKEKIFKKYLFIDQIESFIYDRTNFEKLLYIVQTGKMAGFYVILSLTQDVIVPSILISSIGPKIILNNHFNFIKKIIDDSYFEFINNDIECFYKDKDLLIRMCLLLLSEEEQDKLKTR